jgi:hypothetical protein
MRHSGWAVIVAGLWLATGCTTDAQPSVNTSAAPTANRGDALVAAGFRMVPANTPERQTALRQLPPQQFVRKLRGDKVVFVYADPANCNCLYAGNVTAYSTYQSRTREDKALADEQAMDNWNWSTWAFGFPSTWPD